MVNGIRPSPPVSAAAVEFDLSRIDTPVEAMLMPVVDLVTVLGVDSQYKRSSVSLKAGDETLDYTFRRTATGAAIDGSMNGRPFHLDMNDGSPPGATFEGKTPGGDIQGQLQVVPAAGLHVSGQAGEVPFEEILVVNPFGGRLVAVIKGKIGGQTLEESLKEGPNGTLVVEGHLGEESIHRQTSLNPDGSLSIQGTIGDLEVEVTLRNSNAGAPEA